MKNNELINPKKIYKDFVKGFITKFDAVDKLIALIEHSNLRGVRAECIEKIAKLLIENDLRISFKVNLRAETFTNDDVDLLKLLKRAGMDIIVLGIEACNDKELELFGKNADIDTIKRAYWRLRDMDCFSLLIGYIGIHPYSTIKSVRRSFEFLRELKLSYAYNIFRNVLIPLRGTNIYDKLKSVSSGFATWPLSFH